MDAESAADVNAAAVVVLDVVVMDVATSAGNGDGGYEEVADASVDGIVTTGMGSDVFMVDTANCWCCWSVPC